MFAPTARSVPFSAFVVTSPHPACQWTLPVARAVAAPLPACRWACSTGADAGGMAFGLSPGGDGSAGEDGDDSAVAVLCSFRWAFAAGSVLVSPRFKASTFVGKNQGI